jgi:hypothetical protein
MAHSHPVNTCPQCRERLPLEAFYAETNGSKGGGRFRVCKRCHIERVRAYQLKRKLAKVVDAPVAPVMSNVSDTEREPSVARAGNATPIAAGQRFNRLVAIMRVKNSAAGNQQWLWKCDCGTEIIRRPTDITSGRTKSCGCLSRELSSSRYREALASRMALTRADAPVAPVAPSGPVILSDLQIRRHAEWYQERAYRRYSPAALAAGELDAELRERLRQEVGPDRAEVEFARILRIARRQ